MTTTVLQEKVIWAAQIRLRAQGVKTVCFDKLPTDEEIERNGFNDAVDVLVDEILYWE